MMMGIEEVRKDAFLDPMKNMMMEKYDDDIDDDDNVSDFFVLKLAISSQSSAQCESHLIHQHNQCHHNYWQFHHWQYHYNSSWGIMN